MTTSVHTIGLSNSEADKQAALQEAEDFGRREGQGAAARAAFYVTLIEMAKAKRADVSDAEAFWDKFARGASKGASMIGGTKDDSAPDDVRKVRVSEARTFIKLGALVLVDPVEVMDRAIGIVKRAKQDERLKGKPTDAMLAVARAQCNDSSNPLEDETIEMVIQPKEGAEKVEADALEPLRVGLERVLKKFGDSDEVLDAIGYIQKRQDDLGGTSKQIKAAASIAKKAAKAMLASSRNSQGTV